MASCSSSDSDFAMNCEISETAACNVFITLALLTGLLFCGDQFSVFYDVLMWLMDWTQCTGEWTMAHIL